jgi:cytochrome c biogenesis protein CcdA
VFTAGWADDLTGPYGVPFAFAAGVVSFLSPCVLPLVPAYVAHLTGVTAAPETPSGRRETLSHALAFVSVTGTLRRFHRFLPALEVSMGAVVLLVGVLIFLNEFTSMNQYFNFLPELNSV